MTKNELIAKLQEMLKLTGYQLSWLTGETLEAIIENFENSR